MENDKIEIIEVWQPVESGGDAFDFERNKNLKLIAMFANGVPMKLENGYVMWKKYISTEEYNQWKKN